MTASADDPTVEELYLRHHAALRRFLTRMLRCEEAAADVAQEAYLRLLRFAPRRAVDDPRAYLFRVAANAARDRMARERVREGIASGPAGGMAGSMAGNMSGGVSGQSGAGQSGAGRGGAGRRGSGGRPPEETIACPQADAEAVAAGRERLAILSHAVDELPPRCREVFLLSRLDGLSNGEIAQRLGISRNMVEKHIIKAMVHCRRRLDAAGK
ncbi:MAG: sigma-70 family RNA polymerase sigma factor [Rhodospirillaceae bacterium]